MRIVDKMYFVFIFSQYYWLTFSETYIHAYRESTWSWIRVKELNTRRFKYIVRHCNLWIHTFISGDTEEILARYIETKSRKPQFLWMSQTISQCECLQTEE